MNDLRFAFRQLLKNPGFTAVAVFTLALGIGANTAIFSVIHGVWLKPLPYPEPHRLVTLWERDLRRGLDQGLVSGPNFLDWKAQSTVFENMAVNPGWQGVGDFNLVQREGVVKIKASYVAASFFPTLGVSPQFGRTFLPDEDRKEGNRVAVLSHGLWQNRFGGDSNVIGQKLTVDTYGRRDYTIVGVMPQGFGVPSESELWLPLGWMGVTLDERRNAHWHNVIARLKPGVTLKQATAELNTIQARLAQQYPEALIGTEVLIVPLLEQTLGRNLSRALVVLWGVIVGVLLIACANVANLLLARAATREREIALRLTLGASRWRVVRQLLAESLLLGICGGAGGVVLAWWALKLFVAASPGNIPRLPEVSLDDAALAFTMLVSVLTGVLFGMVPAWQLSRPDLNDALKESSRGTSSGRASHRLRDLLVVGEVALSLMLLIGAGLMLRSFARLMFMDRGFKPEQVVTAKLDYSVSGFTTWVRPTQTRPQVTQFQLMERLRQTPGVRSVAVTGGLPKNTGEPPNQPILIQGRAVGSANELPRSSFQAVSPDYFRTLGVPLRRGRDFTEADQYEAPLVVLINETMARRYFPNQDPVGQRIAMPDRNNLTQPESPWYTNHSPWWEIVGVVADMKSLSPNPEPLPHTYVPYWQWPMQGPTLVVRATGDPAALTTTIRSAVREVIPSLPRPVIRTMDAILDDTMAQPRFQASLLGLFGVVALVLAAVGLYGVLAYTVTQRTHEIGIRMALGAQKQNVVSLVVGQGMRLALLGVGLGLVAAWMLSRVLRTLLYEVQPTDPLTFVAVSLLLLGTALVACWLPARRAAKVDPMEALRYE